ncbi:MAG: hypothetical protein WBK91_04010 [Alphaproteobacteria bacterium]
MDDLPNSCINFNGLTDAAAFLCAWYTFTSHLWGFTISGCCMIVSGIAAWRINRALAKAMFNKILEIIRKALPSGGNEPPETQ